MGTPRAAERLARFQLRPNLDSAALTWVGPMGREALYVVDSLTAMPGLGRAIRYGAGWDSTPAGRTA